MSGIVNMSIVVILLGVLGILVPVLIGVFVYRDAKSRNMDALLWSLVALLVPSFIGLLIYLVLRSGRSGLNCPGCRRSVEPDYAVCPHCGAPLKGACPNCQSFVEPGWKACPKCGAALPERPEGAAPTPKRDRGLLWILIAVIAIPLLLLAIVLGGLMAARDFGKTTYTSESYSIDWETEGLAPGIREWVAECDARGEGVYALRVSGGEGFSWDLYDAAGEEMDDVYAVYVYVRLPSEDAHRALKGAAEVRGRVLRIAYVSGEVSGEEATLGAELSSVSAAGSSVDALEITIDGAEVAYSMTELEAA